MGRWIDIIRKVVGWKSHGKTGLTPSMDVPRMPKFGLGRYQEIGTDFFEKILERDYEQVYISNRSSLWDFPEDWDVLAKKVNQVYGIDLSDIPDGNLVKIFEKIGKSEKWNSSRR